MTEFLYEKYIVVIEGTNRGVGTVTLDDEQMTKEFGQSFANLCRSFIVVANQIESLGAAGATD